MAAGDLHVGIRSRKYGQSGDHAVSSNFKLTSVILTAYDRGLDECLASLKATKIRILTYHCRNRVMLGTRKKCESINVISCQPYFCS